uniref:IRS-type PTB domain-containing protein n=1 Tax=Heligmosomoides polygyrus TaxID=6339 RepID=A0A183G804_HELPZ
LEELHETLLKDYNQMGGAEDDLRHLREDRMKLEKTARSTYEYGRQLCQVALVLRRSLRMDVKNQIGLNEKLEQTWGRLCRALSENEAKLNVTEAFNTTIIEVNHRIEELGLRVQEVRESQMSPERVCAHERRRLTNDIQELRHIANMLIAQVNANHNVTPEARQTAIASIRRKVDSVDAAHRRLDSLFVEVAEPPPRTHKTMAEEKKAQEVMNEIENEEHNEIANDAVPQQIIEVHGEPEAPVMAHQPERVDNASITQNIQQLVNSLMFELQRARADAEEKEGQLSISRFVRPLALFPDTSELRPIDGWCLPVATPAQASFAHLVNYQRDTELLPNGFVSDEVHARDSSRPAQHPRLHSSPAIRSFVEGQPPPGDGSTDL